MYLCPNKTVKWFSTNCDLIRRGTWKYEYGALKMYSKGQEVAFVNVIKFEKNILTLDTTREWVRLSKNNLLNRLC